MPKLALSNIALSAYDHGDELQALAGLGLEAVEVAPSRVWRDTWRGLEAAAVEGYRRLIEAAGLKVVGLHSLFYDQPELGLFKDSDARAGTLDFLEHLSALCRDLGGRTLIYGGGRHRNGLPVEEAKEETIRFFGDLYPRIEDHGTCFCFEPLEHKGSDFINSAFESLEIVQAVNHPSLKIQLDAKALAANDEAKPSVFKAVAGHLVHFHANEPDLGVLGSSGEVDHAALGGMLRGVGYDGFVSMEQKMIGAGDPLDAVSRSAAVLKACYP